MRKPGLGDEVQQAELGEHVGVPVGSGADQAGQAAHPIGERAPARASTSRAASASHVSYRARAGSERPVRRAVVEPAIELDETLEHASDAFVAGAIEIVAVGLAVAVHRPPPRRRIGVVPIDRLPAAPSVAGVARTTARMTSLREARRSRPVDPRRDRWRRNVETGTSPRTQSRSRASACLQGSRRLGHVQRHATSAWSTIVS